MTHMRHVCMQKGEIIHAHSHTFPSHTRAHLKNALSALKAEQYPECVSRLCALPTRPQYCGCSGKKMPAFLPRVHTL